MSHISIVKAAVPNTVEGTTAGDTSAALLRKMLPADAAQATEGDGDAMVVDEDCMRDLDRDGERDGDAADDSDGEADTAAHTAFAHANVCVKALVSGTLESTCADAPRSNNVCVAARFWQKSQTSSGARLVKTTKDSIVGAASNTCQNSSGPVPPDAKISYALPIRVEVCAFRLPSTAKEERHGPDGQPRKTERLDVCMPSATLKPLVLKACICTKLMYVEPPVFTILMAATGMQAGNAERDGVGCRDMLLDADDERDARETLADALRERERDADTAAAAREPDGDGERDRDRDKDIPARVAECERDGDTERERERVAVAEREREADLDPEPLLPRADVERERDSERDRVCDVVRVGDAEALREALRERLAITVGATLLLADDPLVADRLRLADAVRDLVEKGRGDVDKLRLRDARRIAEADADDEDLLVLERLRHADAAADRDDDGDLLEDARREALLEGDGEALQLADGAAAGQMARMRLLPNSET